MYPYVCTYVCMYGWMDVSYVRMEVCMYVCRYVCQVSMDGRMYGCTPMGVSYAMYARIHVSM